MLGDRVVARWRNGRLLLAAGAAALAAPLALGGILAPAGQAALAIPLFMLAYGLWQMYYGLVYAAIQDTVPPGLRATAMAAYLMVMYLAGGAFGPLVTGRLSDYPGAAGGRRRRADGGGESGGPAPGDVHHPGIIARAGDGVVGREPGARRSRSIPRVDGSHELLESRIGA